MEESDSGLGNGLRSTLHRHGGAAGTDASGEGNDGGGAGGGLRLTDAGGGTAAGDVKSGEDARAGAPAAAVI